MLASLTLDFLGTLGFDTGSLDNFQLFLEDVQNFFFLIFPGIGRFSPSDPFLLLDGLCLLQPQGFPELPEILFLPLGQHARDMDCNTGNDIFLFYDSNFFYFTVNLQVRNAQLFHLGVYGSFKLRSLTDVEQIIKTKLLLVVNFFHQRHPPHVPAVAPKQTTIPVEVLPPVGNAFHGDVTAVGIAHHHANRLAVVCNLVGSFGAELTVVDVMRLEVVSIFHSLTTGCRSS